ncbi:hypothetical protein ACTS91_02100 [Empedobacter falsenii]|uniref:hypothetical protein n=1 Tax=unclassified Empedobacter TaxID=2643773 RepID=UPI00244C3E5F|nr:MULTISPECIES: hypothetical protein [unclassified Empedobacter]MDH0673820.1 hypothetical protein [Empedobacter sp. GD03861]MDH1883209.1 hypothetical protein [Empedobacter sp. GD03797]
MKIKLSKTQSYFLGILAVVIVCAFIYREKQKSFTNILKKSRYTIGNISKINYYKGDDYYHYEYYYNNILLVAGISESSSNNLFVGKRYFVVFEEGNPENSMLIPFLFVPDSITKAPAEGWQEPPIPIDKNEIKKFLDSY